MANKYTIEQAKALYAEAVRLKLLGTENLADAELVAKVCNGIGAAWMPDFMRRLADKLNPVMEYATAIHDVDYERGGDDSDRLAADVVFHANCLISIDSKYPWYHPWRYVMRARADRFYLYLRTCGGAAWAGSTRGQMVGGRPAASLASIESTDQGESTGEAGQPPRQTEADVRPGGGNVPLRNVAAAGADAPTRLDRGNGK